MGYFALTVETFGVHGATKNSWCVQSAAITSNQFVTHYRTENISGYTVGEVSLTGDGGSAVQFVKRRSLSPVVAPTISLKDVDNMEFLSIGMDVDSDQLLPLIIRVKDSYYLGLGNTYLCQVTDQSRLSGETGDCLNFSVNLKHHINAPLNFAEYWQRIRKREEPHYDFDSLDLNSCYLSGGFNRLEPTTVCHLFMRRPATLLR